MVIAETLPIDVDHQQIRLIPAAFPQLAQLFSAAFDCLATDAATRDAGRLSHLGQNFLVLTRRNSTQQRSPSCVARWLRSPAALHTPVLSLRLPAYDEAAAASLSIGGRRAPPDHSANRASGYPHCSFPASAPRPRARRSASELFRWSCARSS